MATTSKTSNLARFTKNHKFKLGYKFVYLNGGVRRDSSESSKLESADAPNLPDAQISDLLKSHQELIVAAARRQEAGHF